MHVKSSIPRKRDSFNTAKLHKRCHTSSRGVFHYQILSILIHDTAYADAWARVAKSGLSTYLMEHLELLM